MRQAWLGPWACRFDLCNNASISSAAATSMFAATDAIRPPVIATSLSALT